LHIYDFSVYIEDGKFDLLKCLFFVTA